MLDISTTSEDTLKVDPSSLNIYPDIKESHDTIQFVFPAKSIFLKHLEVKPTISIQLTLKNYLQADITFRSGIS